MMYSLVFSYEGPQPGPPHHGKLLPGGRWCDSCKEYHGAWYPCPSYSAKIIKQIARACPTSYEDLRQMQVDIKGGRS